jgi:hypothetical protein
MGTKVSKRKTTYEEKLEIESNFAGLSPEEKRERCQLRNKIEGVFIKESGFFLQL